MQKLPGKSTPIPLTPSQSEILQLLWKEHSGAVYAMLLDWCGNKTNAADILQEVFLRLARNPSLLESIRQPRAFLFVSARRIGIDQARKNKVEEAVVESGDLEIFSTQHDAAPGDDLHQILQDAFKLLPEEQRAVLEAKLLHGKTLALIASEQGISLNTASSRLRYSLDKMRVVLRPYYGTMKKSYLNPNASQRLNSNNSANERLIKPLEPKRVPSVSPLLSGLVALAPEHDTHDTLSDIPVSVDTHTDQPAATSDHPAETQDHTPTPAVEAAPSDSSNPLPVSAQDPEVVLTSLFEETHLDKVASVVPEPFALESFLSINTTEVTTDNTVNHDTTVTDTGVATQIDDGSTGAGVDNSTSHDVTSSDPSTTDAQSIDPTTGLPIDNTVNHDTTVTDTGIATQVDDGSTGAGVDNSTSHDVTSSDPSTTDAQPIDPTTGLPIDDTGNGTDVGLTLPTIDPSTGFVAGTDHFMNFGGIQFSNDGGAAIGYGGINHTPDAGSVNDSTDGSVNDGTSHDVTSTDPTTSDTNIDPTTGLHVDNSGSSTDVTSTDPIAVEGHIDYSTTGVTIMNDGTPGLTMSDTGHFINYGGVEFNLTGGGPIGYGGIDHTAVQRDAHPLDVTSQNVPDHAVSSVDPALLSSNVSAASVDPAPSSHSSEASTHEAAVNTVNSASPVQHPGSVYYDSIWQNSSTSNLAQNQEGPTSAGHFSEIGVAEHQGGALINLNQPNQEGLSYVSPNLNFYGVENTQIEGSHDGALDSAHSPNSHEELPSEVHPAALASIQEIPTDDFTVISESSMTESTAHDGSNEASPITEHSPSSIGTPEILGGAFIAGTATQAAPASSLSKMARRSVRK